MCVVLTEATYVARLDKSTPISPELRFKILKDLFPLATQHASLIQPPSASHSQAFSLDFWPRVPSHFDQWGLIPRSDAPQSPFFRETCAYYVIYPLPV